MRFTMKKTIQGTDGTQIQFWQALEKQPRLNRLRITTVCELSNYPNHETVQGKSYMNPHDEYDTSIGREQAFLHAVQKLPKPVRAPFWKTFLVNVGHMKEEHLKGFTPKPVPASV